MKNRLLVPGIIILLALVGGTYIGMTHLRTRGEDRECRQFVDDFIRAVAEEWDANEIAKRASPEWLETLTREQLDEFAVSMRQLGKIQKYGGSVGGPVVHNATKDEVIIARLLADAKFDAGSARFSFELIRHGGKWQIYHLIVESDVISQ
jgi:hypothetical protein